MRHGFGRLIHHIESLPASDRLLLRVLFFAAVFSLAIAITLTSRAFLVSVPVAGGTVTEGIVGVPRFVNPALAVTRADLDMTTLIYRGLMRINPEGELVPDIAESITRSEDGKTYNVILRRDVRFHDDTPLTARDVAFTIGLIQDNELKSPLRANWNGVTVEEIGEYELNIVLEEAYAPFRENFTLGIMPRHIWNELSVEQIPFSIRNTEPIGAGPFKIESVQRDESGLITEYILERAREDVTLTRLVVRFFVDEPTLVNAVTTGEVTSTASLSPVSLNTLTTNNIIITELALPRLYSLFYNQNRSPVLRDSAVRQALELALDRESIIDAAVSGYGIPNSTAIPSRENAVHSTSTQLSERQEIARNTLTTAGWQPNQNGVLEKRIDGNVEPLSLTIKTSEDDIFITTATLVAEQWRAIGVQVNVEPYAQSDLVQTVIRPRDFAVLLFGIDMNRAVDLYPFWHSSQRDDPGLNITQYANRDVDTALTALRNATNSDERVRLENAVIATIGTERPAAFLFIPTIPILRTNFVSTASTTDLSRPHERLMNVETWHVARENRWLWR